MRDLTSGTPATREGNWCDGGNARISWARHTSHTYHTYFIVCEILNGEPPPRRRLSRPERTLPEWANCRGTRARRDAPSKSGRSSCHPSKRLACLGLNHHHGDWR